MKLPVLFASLFPLVQFAAGPQPVNAPDTYAKIPIYFVENRGQLDQQVAFYLQGRDTRAYFTSDGVTFAVDEPGGRWVTKLEFVDANPNTRPAGRHATPAVVSYFKGAAAD